MLLYRMPFQNKQHLFKIPAFFHLLLHTTFWRQVNLCIFAFVFFRACLINMARNVPPPPTFLPCLGEPQMPNPPVDFQQLLAGN